MTSDDYLDKILKKMVPSHNIVRGYSVKNKTFDAYAQYISSCEKYVLTRKANLWKVSESEHVIFLSVPSEAKQGEFVEEAERLIADYMEPAFSRNNEKYPPKDHMRTFLTVVLVMECSPGRQLIRKIQRYRYDKSYLFSLRGYSQGRLIAVDLPSQKVHTSPAARDVAGFYRQAL